MLGKVWNSLAICSKEHTWRIRNGYLRHLSLDILRAMVPVHVVRWMPGTEGWAPYLRSIELCKPSAKDMAKLIYASPNFLIPEADDQAKREAQERRASLQTIALKGVINRRYRCWPGISAYAKVCTHTAYHWSVNIVCVNRLADYLPMPLSRSVEKSKIEPACVKIGQTSLFQDSLCQIWAADTLPRQSKEKPSSCRISQWLGTSKCQLNLRNLSRIQEIGPEKLSNWTEMSAGSCRPQLCSQTTASDKVSIKILERAHSHSLLSFEDGILWDWAGYLNFVDALA